MSVKGILDTAANTPLQAAPSLPLKIKKSSQKLDGKTTWIVKQAGKAQGVVVKDKDSKSGKLFLTYLPREGKSQALASEAISGVIVQLKAKQAAKASAAAKPVVVAQAALAAETTAVHFNANHFPVAPKMTDAQRKGVVEAADHNLRELVNDMQKECEALETRLKQAGEMQAMLPPKGTSQAALYAFYRQFDLAKADQLLAPIPDRKEHYAQRKDAIHQRYTSAHNQDATMAQAIQKSFTECTQRMTKLSELRKALPTGVARDLAHAQNLAKTLVNYEKDLAALKTQFQATQELVTAVKSAYTPELEALLLTAVNQLSDLSRAARELEVVAGHLTTQIGTLDATMKLPTSSEEIHRMCQQLSAQFVKVRAYGKVLGDINAQNFHLITKADIADAKAAKLPMDPIEQALKAQLRQLMARPMAENVADEKLEQCLALIPKPDQSQAAKDLLTLVQKYQAIEINIHRRLARVLTEDELAFIATCDSSVKALLEARVVEVLKELTAFNLLDEYEKATLGLFLQRLEPLGRIMGLENLLLPGYRKLAASVKAISAQKVVVYKAVLLKVENRQFAQITKEELEIAKTNQEQMEMLGLKPLHIAIQAQLEGMQMKGMQTMKTVTDVPTLKDYVKAIKRLAERTAQLQAERNAEAAAQDKRLAETRAKVLAAEEARAKAQAGSAPAAAAAVGDFNASLWDDEIPAVAAAAPKKEAAFFSEIESFFKTVGNDFDRSLSAVGKDMDKLLGLAPPAAAKAGAGSAAAAAGAAKPSAKPVPSISALDKLAALFE